MMTLGWRGPILWHSEIWSPMSERFLLSIGAWERVRYFIDTHRYSCKKIISMYRKFCSVPLFINTSVGNYTYRNGTEQDEIVIK